MNPLESFKQLKKNEYSLRGSSLRFLPTRIIDMQKQSKNKILDIKNPRIF